MNELKKEVIKTEIENNQKAVIRAELAERFYRYMSTQQDSKNKRGDFAMKADQSKQQGKFAQEFVDFLKSIEKE